MEGFDMDNNDVQIDESVAIRGRIEGHGNVVRIGATKFPTSAIHLDIRGNNNVVVIGENSRAKKLVLRVGNHVQAHGCVAHIGDDFSSEPNCVFYLYTSGNKLEIGNDCMFSRDIVLRCGDSPHLLFDAETGEYLDTDGHVVIGNKVWVGEYSYITKKVSLPSNTIVAAKSVVTRKFTEEYCALGGNPAKVVRRGVKWVRNRGFLEPGTPEHTSYHAYQKTFRD